MRPSRPLLLVLISVIAALSVVVAAVALAQQYSSEDKLHKSISINATEKRFQDIIADMNNFPGSAGRDVLFLRALSADDMTGSGGTQAIAADFKAFIDKNEAYRQLYLFGAGKQCLLMAGRDQSGSSCQAVPAQVADALQAAATLDGDDIYVSPLVALGAPDSNKSIPSLLYASRQGETVVVAVIDADYFLEEVRRLTRPDETVLLLDKDGTYLANPDPTKEQATGSSATFYTDYPAVPKSALTRDSRDLEADGKTFTFHRVYPTGGGFTLSSDSASSSSGEEYYWVIASVTDVKQPEAWWRANSYLFAILSIILLQLVIIGLSFLGPRTPLLQNNTGKKRGV